MRAELADAKKKLKENQHKERDDEEKTAVKWLRSAKIDPFPQEILIEEKYGVWLDYKAKLKIQLESCQAAGQRKLAAHVYGGIGRELTEIVNMRGLLPEVGDVDVSFQFFDNMISGLDDYFKSLSDTAMNVNHLHNMQQKAGELASVFALRLQRQAKVCSVDAEEVVRSLFLKGMLDKTIAGEAYRQGWTLDVTVHAASREEAMAKRAPSFAEVAVVSAVGGRTGMKRKFDPPKWTAAKKPKVEKEGKPCAACGFPSHKDGFCKAGDKKCYKCGAQGHFARMCNKREVAALDSAIPDNEAKVELLN